MPKAPTLEPRLRFPHDGPDAFGPGKAELLRQIDATGSIRTAADRMAMSYNRAWVLVRTMNTLFRTPSSPSFAAEPRAVAHSSPPPATRFCSATTGCRPAALPPPAGTGSRSGACSGRKSETLRHI